MDEAIDPQLIIVISIIAILTTILVVHWIGATRAAYDSEAFATARNCFLAAQIRYATDGYAYSGLTFDEIGAIESSIQEFHDPYGNVVVDSAAAETFQITVTTTRGTPGRPWVVTETGVEVIDG